MDQELKKKWIEALRSGTYKQGQHCLKVMAGNEVFHCCLGVLAEIIDSKTWFTSNRKQDHRKYFAWLGSMAYVLDDRAPTRNTQKILATLNDMNNKSFEEIADWIEDNL